MIGNLFRKIHNNYILKLDKVVKILKEIPAKKDINKTISKRENLYL